MQYRLNDPSSLLLDAVRAVSARIVLIGHLFSMVNVLANLVALAVAIPTEMQHRRVARWLAHLLYRRAGEVLATGPVVG